MLFLSIDRIMTSNVHKSLKQLPVPVPSVPAGRYVITIGRDFLSQLGHVLQQQFAGLVPFVVTDTAVAAAGHLEAILGGRKIGTYIINPPGETSKHIGTVTAIVEQMEKNYLGRDTLIIALGGGTVGDIAGFAAAIYKRGVQVVQIPTTTVSQADSAIGGKTGVDSSISKNAFGAFWHPAAVYIDVSTLKTLDDLQYRAGLVESVKHAVITDANYFEFLENHLHDILKKDLAILEQVAFDNCRIKAAVVAEDPTEKNKRRILNYGHTIGHAVESASGFNLLHGQAIAIGIVAAGQIEKELGLVADNRLQRIENLLKKLDMPTRIPQQYKTDQLIDLLRRDKKALSRWPRFILLEKLGQALCRDGQWAHEVKEEMAGEVIEEMKK